MENPECPKKYSTSRESDTNILNVEDISIGRILSFLDVNSKLEFRSLNKEIYKLVSVRGGWSDTITQLFLPVVELADENEGFTVDDSVFRFVQPPARNALYAIKNKNNRLWFSYFRSVSMLIGNVYLGTNIDQLIQAVSKSLLNQFKSKLI